MSPVDVAKFEAEMNKLGASPEIELNLANSGFFWISVAVIIGFAIWMLRIVSTGS